jgi:hypothetical protein
MPRSFRLLLGATALAAAIGRGEVEPARALDRPQRPAAEPAEPIEWSPTRRLTWGDFLGRPNLASEAVAMTGYEISLDAECEGPTFTFEVVNRFMPDRSWVKPMLLMRGLEARRTLQHEQSHFDLGEVHARELRRALLDMRSPCSRTEQERQDAVTRVLRRDEQMQRQYDLETEFGTDLIRQGEWDTRVARQLTGLKGYARWSQ